jgi:hypothetical protein
MLGILSSTKKRRRGGKGKINKAQEDGTELVYSSGIVIVPALISAVISAGVLPLTVQPIA